MRSLLSRIPFRESRNLVIACGIVFVALLVARIYVERAYDHKGRLERQHRARVAEMEAQGRKEESAALRRDRTLSEQEKRIAERKEKGEVVAPEAYVPVWLYKGLQANLILSGLLLLASAWLGRRLPAGSPTLAAAQRMPWKSWEVAACALLMGLAAWHNAPRLSHSMWGDEEFNASRFMLDSVERTPEGQIEIQERPWMTTLWNMRKPTNHLGYSLFARLTHDTFFEKKTGAHDPWFSEALLRAPVFVSGLLLIPAFLWALRVWGLRAWWGLLLLLLHPWFTRFGVDGRGYGFIMLGATLMLGVLGRALQTGRWRWWIGFGLLGFFQIWSNLQGIYPVAALHLAALASLLLRREQPSSERWLLASRWFVAGMITLLLIVGYLAPCWPQLQEFMAKKEIHGSLDWRFWKDSLCAWLFGQPMQPWDEPENPLRYAMEITLQTLPVLRIGGIVLFLALLIVGIGSLARKAEQRVLLIFSLGAPALMLLHMAVSHNRPYDWYFTTFVPGLFLIIAAGAESLRRRLPSSAVAMALLVLATALYGLTTEPPRDLLRHHALEQSRESVPYYRKAVSNPRHPDIEKEVISAGFTMYTEGYDPALLRFDSVEELQALMKKADDSGRTLAVNVAYLKFARHAPGSKEICTVLESSGLFQHVTTLYGLLPYTTRDVFTYPKRSS